MRDRITGLPGRERLMRPAWPRMERFVVKAFYEQYPLLRDTGNKLGIELDFATELALVGLNWGHLDSRAQTRDEDRFRYSSRVLLLDCMGGLCAEAQPDEDVREAMRRSGAGSECVLVLLIAETWFIGQGEQEFLRRRSIQLTVVPNGYTLESWIASMKAMIAEDAKEMEISQGGTAPCSIQRVVGRYPWLTAGDDPIVFSPGDIAVARVIRYTGRLLRRRASWERHSRSNATEARLQQDLRYFFVDKHGKVLGEAPQEGWNYDGETGVKMSLASALSWFGPDVSRVHYIVALTTFWEVEDEIRLRDQWPCARDGVIGKIARQELVVYRPEDGFSLAKWWKRLQQARRAQVLAVLAQADASPDPASSPHLVIKADEDER